LFFTFPVSFCSPLSFLCFSKYFSYISINPFLSYSLSLYTIFFSSSAFLLQLLLFLK
jgi:hypothetical protein